MSFLGVPLKKTTSVDISGPLTKYSTNKFPSADHSLAISEFSQLRKNVVDRSQDKFAGNSSTLDALTSYYDQLAAAEKKLPISEQDIRIEFKWYDAFGRDSQKQFDIAYEKACVLFNIGACYSQIASSAASQESDDQLKSAAKQFQQSAGIFSWLRENPSGKCPNAKADLSSEVLLALSSLMVAEAQELFYRKAYSDKLRDASAARLAAQASDFYQQALSQMKAVDIWPRDWLNTVSAKQLLLMASAEGHQAAACGADHRYGEQISRLRQAHELSHSAEKTADSSSPLRKTAKEQGGKLKALLDTAVRDNDFIYHEAIPKAESLSTINRAPLAKVLPLELPFNKDSIRDLFSDMVPLQVAESVSAFESRRDAAVQIEVTRLRDATSLLNTVLASLGLPSAVDEICGSGQSAGQNMSLPTTLLTSAEKIRQAGGADAIRRSIGEMPSLANRNSEILDECQRMLDDEQTSDEKLRSEFGATKWNRTPSANLTKSMRDDVNKNRHTLGAAAQADQIVRQKWETHCESLELLSRPPAEIIQALPSGSQNSALAAKLADSSAVRDLRSCLQEVESLKAERDSLEEKIKGQSFENIQQVFLDALMQDGAISEENVSNAKLNDKFGPLREQTTASLQKQEKLLEKLQGMHGKFIEERQKAAGGNTVSDTVSERDKMLGRLQSAAAAFSELQNHLEEGKNFYGKMTVALLKLQSSINDFTFARKTEKDDLMLSIQRDAASSSRRQQEEETQQRAQAAAAAAATPKPAAPAVPPQPAQYQQYGQPPQPGQPGQPGGYLPYPGQPGAPGMPPMPYPYQGWPAQPMSQTWGPGYAPPPGQMAYPPQQPGQNPYYPQYFPPQR